MKAFKKELTMFAVMIALAIVTAVANPLFLGGDNIRNNIRHISLISLFALGEAMVIIAGGIDLSIGSVICISGVTTSYLTMYGGLGIGAAVAIGYLIALAVGAIQGGVIARFGIPSFVVTLGFMLLLRGIAEVLTGGTDVGFQGTNEGFRALGKGEALGMPTPFWFALGAMLLVAFLMHRTLFGRYCYAIGSNPEAARLSGVPVTAVRLFTFIAGALLSGVAGMLYVGYLPTATPSLGASYELHAIAAAVLGGVSLQGGKGTVFGVVIGAGILQITFNAVNLIGQSLWQNVVAGGVILAAVIVDQLIENRRALGGPRSPAPAPAATPNTPAASATATPAVEGQP
jgi:ribose/xylose/arabinose/galactoside ABC-type transport system permease subunit